MAMVFDNQVLRDPGLSSFHEKEEASHILSGQAVSSNASKTFSGMLWDMAGGDDTLPSDRPDPEREWVVTARPDDVAIHRLVSVEKWDDTCRTVYRLVSAIIGSCIKNDVHYCYPKDQWTEEEARAHAQGHMERMLLEADGR